MFSTLYFVSNKIILRLILVSAFLTIVTSNYESRHGLMNGLAFPSEIDAVVGEEVYLKIIEPVAHQTNCHYRQTSGKDVDVKMPHKQNFELWKKETCGLRIKNVTTDEHGFWRLTSSNDNDDVARGIVFINVRSEDPNQPTKKDIDSIDIDIAPEQTSYCYVVRPDDKKTAFPQHENCDFPKFHHSESESNGIWHVVSGVKGKTQEVTFQVNVQANVEQLQTFVEHNSITSALNMKCKLVNTKKMMKFCRFLRLNDDVGFNLQDGRGDERISYYGNGFENLECGISIGNVDQNDKSPWKCFIGVDDDGELKTMGAIIDGSDSQQTNTQGDIETSDVYGLQDTEVNILCKRYIPTDYCWFRDPAGQKISISDQKAPDDNDIYRYYGTGIKLGECGLTILNAAHNHSGTWSCHLGSTHIAAADTVQEISVRITETPLVSTNLFQEAQHDTSLLVECRSIPEHVPLEYCRFELPDGNSFSINEKTTIHNPYMNNYYFNPNRKMSSGYCSIIVKKVDRSQQGQWTCVAKLQGSDSESSDEFRVTVFDSNMSVASVTGMIFAVIFLIGGIIFITYRGYRQKYNQRRSTSHTVVTYVTSTDAISIHSYSSNGSQSNSQIDNSQFESNELQSIRLS